MGVGQLSADLIFPTVDGFRTGQLSIRGVARPNPRAEAVQRRLDALAAVARFHGIEIDRRGFRAIPGEAIPSPAALAAWLHGSGLWAKAVRLRWRQLLRVQSNARSEEHTSELQ